MTTGSLVFLTVNGGVYSNPNSLRVIQSLRNLKSLRERDATFITAQTPHEIVSLSTTLVAVALFDKAECGGKRYNIRPPIYPDNPYWIRDRDAIISSAVAIGDECVRFPAFLETAAINIANEFVRELGRKIGSKLPKVRKSTVSRRRFDHTQVTGLFRSRLRQ